ncbi:hypothetical protein AB0425_39380 [Actinosynnema sp. NPDC051121]
MGVKWKATAAAVAVGVLATATTAAADTGGWTRVAAPESGLEYTLEDISAAGPDLAYAVGLGESAGGLFLLRWDGSRWRHEEGLPERTGYSALFGVHARGDGVLAVGQDWVSGATRPLLLARRGGLWTKAVGAVPDGEQARLSDVAFVADGTGWAVGREGSGLTERPVAHRWNGTALERFALPAASTYAEAKGVAGTSTGDVWAVGTDGGLAGAASRGVAWRWNGVAWREVPVPAFGAQQVELTDVVAAGAGVWAVGRADGRPLTLAWTGSAWTEVTMPVVADGTRINAAADDGHGGLWVAGETKVGRESMPFLGHHQAGDWRVESPEGLSHTSMRGITAIPGTAGAWSAGRYFRVGSYCYGCRATIAVFG